MTPEQFESAVSRTRLKPRAREMAYRVLVLGQTGVQVAQDMEVSKAAVSMAAHRVSRAHHFNYSPPAGWKPVTVLVPDQETEDRIRRFERAAMRRAKLLK